MISFYFVHIETLAAKIAAKFIFSRVYVTDAACFDECLTMWKLTDVLFAKSLSSHFFNRHIFVFFEISVFKEVHTLRISPITVQWQYQRSKIKSMVCYTYTWWTVVADLFYDNIFYSLVFDCSTLYFFIHEFFWKTTQYNFYK